MKIFEIRWTTQDEKSWVSAETNIEALQTYCRVSDFDISDFDNMDEIVELPEHRWDKLFVSDEDGLPDKNFLKWMEENKESDIICETAYC